MIQVSHACSHGGCSSMHFFDIHDNNVIWWHVIVACGFLLFLVGGLMMQYDHDDIHIFILHDNDFYGNYGM